MYGKLFASMYEGTLYGQWQAIVTLQQLVILADKDGVVDMTPPAIAARTSIPLDIIEAGLSQLAEADKYSRSEAADGRRIVLIDDDRPWGWKIVNYAKYRDMRSAEDRKAYMREYMRDKRKQEKLTDANSKQPLAMLANTDTDTDIDKRGARKRATPPPKHFEVDEDLKAWASTNARGVDLAAETAKFLDYHTAKGSSFKDWRAAWRTWMRKAVEFRGPVPDTEKPPKDSPPHMAAEAYASQDDDGKRAAWVQWKNIFEKQRARP